MKNKSLIRKLLPLLFCFATSAGFCDSWSVPSEIPGSSSVQSYGSPFTSFDSVTNQFLVTWSDLATEQPFYSIYDVTTDTWSAPLSITTLSTVGGDDSEVFTSFDPTANQFMATWNNFDGVNSQPFFSIYDVTTDTWSPDLQIPGSSASSNSSEVFNSFDLTAKRFMVTWNDQTDLPYYSIYDVVGDTWSTPGPISNILNGGEVIPTTFDSATNKFMATWHDSVSHLPVYSIYTVAGDTWSTPGAIGSSPVVDSFSNDIYTSFDSTANQFIATWQDGTTNLPFYSIYNVAGDTWSLPKEIPNSSVVFSSSDIHISFDSTTDQFMATWTDGTTLRPYYSIYNVAANTWSSPVAISDVSSAGDDYDGEVFISFDSMTNQFMATWTDDTTLEPFFSVYSFSPSPPPPSPPPPSPPPISSLEGMQRKNDFGLEYELYNLLLWVSNPSSTVVSYNIYRNGVLIATVDASVHKYEDHNRKKNTITQYSVTAVDAHGVESSPVIINI